MRKSRVGKKRNDEAQVDELIESLRICSQSSSCTRCMFAPMKAEYSRAAGRADFTCRSALMDTAAELICDFFD